MANENTKPKTPKSALLALMGLGFILALIGLLYSPGPETPAEPLVGIEAPDFPFETESGIQQTLVGLRGQVVLINFWAYWCEPCLQEIPSLQRLEKHFEGRDFSLLMVHVGDEREEALKVPGLPRHQVLGISPTVLASYGVSGLPHTVLVDKRGLVLAEFRGPIDWMAPHILSRIEDPMG